MATNDNDVNNDASEQNTGTDAASTADNNNTEAVGTGSLLDAMKADPELNGDIEAGETEDSGQSEEQPEADDESDKPDDQSDDTDEPTDEDSRPTGRKAQDRIRGLSAENRALKDRVAELEGQRNVPHTVDEYVEAGYSEAAAEVQAMREEMRVEKENARVAQLNANMHEDSVNAEHDYPIFDNKSDDFDKDFAEAVAADYQRYANLQLDPTGQYILRADIPMYDFYKSAAERYERGLTRGRASGAADSAKQYASAEQAPSARPAPKKQEDSNVDKLLSGMRARLPS